MFDRPTVVIMSGLPGSGKSTWYRNNINDNYYSVSADDYFLVENNYKFDATKLPQAHASCFSKFIELIRNGAEEIIIVDNCGSKLHDISPYILAAQAYGYDHIIICCNARVETCLARQTHNVPEHTLRNMEKNLIEMYQKLPYGWNVKHINTENK